jgi:BMFP domain-containing protein YqiC
MARRGGIWILGALWFAVCFCDLAWFALMSLFDKTICWLVQKVLSMVQTQNKIFDDMAGLVTDAIGLAQSVRREAENMARQGVERVLTDLEMVRRDEFELIKDKVLSFDARLKAIEEKLGLAASAQG